MGHIIALVLGCAITGASSNSHPVHHQGAGAFDIFFVNSLTCPSSSALPSFFILLTALIIVGIRWAVRKQYYYPSWVLWCAASCSWAIHLFHHHHPASNADPADGHVQCRQSRQPGGLFSRDQYGGLATPLRPDFTDRAPRVDGGPLYVKGKKNTRPPAKDDRTGLEQHSLFHLFPRMWDGNNDRNQVDCYRQYTGLGEDDAAHHEGTISNMHRLPGLTGCTCATSSGAIPASRTTSRASATYGNGNFVTGISFIDNYFYGDQSKMPDSIHKNNKSYNRLYMLPSSLASRLAFQYKRNRRDSSSPACSSHITGFGIVFYLNQARLPAPAKRDYAFAGSCYALPYGSASASSGGRNTGEVP